MDMQVTQKLYPGLLPANRMAEECVREEYQCIGRQPYQESPFYPEVHPLPLWSNFCFFAVAYILILCSSLLNPAHTCYMNILFFNLQRFSCYLFKKKSPFSAECVKISPLSAIMGSNIQHC